MIPVTQCLQSDMSASAILSFNRPTHGALKTVNNNNNNNNKQKTLDVGKSLRPSAG